MSFLSSFPLNCYDKYTNLKNALTYYGVCALWIHNVFIVHVPKRWNSLKRVMIILCHTTFWTKRKILWKMSLKSEGYFIWHRLINSFNLIEALMSLTFLITLSVYIYVLITLMLVNLFVWNVNVFVNSCNVLYICK